MNIPLYRFLSSLFFFILSILVLPSSSPISCQEQKNTLFNVIFSNYDDQVRPYFNQSILTISTSFRINLLFAIDAKNEVFSLDLFTREQWLDPRLRFNSTMWDETQLGLLRVPITQKLWKPDTFFYNAVSCTVYDQLITLNNKGLLTWTRHQNCQFHTSFDLRNFPFDSQKFGLRRLSFAYNINSVKLTTMNPCYSPDPLLTFENSLWDIQQATCIMDFFSFRNIQAPYSEVRAELNLNRKSQNYIVKMIAPMFVLTMLSTVTYWIDANSAPARVGGTVTLVLSIVTFNLVVSSDLPKINYSTLLDWYVWYCFLFVVFAVAEFAFVNHIISSKRFPEQIGRLTDEFCAHTLTVCWILSNLIYWPLIDSGVLKAFIGIIEAAYFFANLYKTIWNYRNKKRGFAIIPHLKQKYGQYYNTVREQGVRRTLDLRRY